MDFFNSVDIFYEAIEVWIKKTDDFCKCVQRWKCLGFLHIHINFKDMELVLKPV